MDACGLFAYDRNLAIISTAINLVISVVLGLKLGMLGIFIGTAVSTIFEVIFKSSGIYHKRLLLPEKKYGVLWIRMAVSELTTLVLSCLIAEISCGNLYLDFMVHGCLAVAGAVIVYGILFPKDLRELRKRMLKR